MRWVVRLLLFGAGTAVLAVLGVFCWLYFYAGDLPDIRALAQYAPESEGKASDPCLAFSDAVSSSTAVPYEEIGTNLRKAISAVETSESDPGVLRTTIRGLLIEQPRRPTTVASWYISRTMCYPRLRSLERQLRELRTAIQLDRHYSRKQLFTIYANRVFLGPNLIGVEDGSEFYFRRGPATLSLPDAALLAGLIRGPSRLSPVKHPDRALRRRNEVIDAMVENGSITAAEAQVAKNAPLGVAIGATTAAAPVRTP